MKQALVVCAALVTFVACMAPPAGKRVDVGGHRLRYIQKNEGGPTVVFDAGMGDSLKSWDTVWPEICDFTGVFLYDRAGIGRSDAGPTPRTSEQIVRELRALLDGAGVNGPFILVGHSFGALNMRLFATLYPDDVVGLVLVDPTPIEYPAREEELASEESRRRTQTLLPLRGEALRLERESAEESANQVRDAGSPQQIPVVVVSSTRTQEPATFQSAWIEMQERLVQRLGARHIVTSQSGHYIQYDEPQLVIGAIREIWESTGR